MKRVEAGRSDEIGKHTRLKSARRKACGFKSHLRHHMKNKTLNPDKYLLAYIVGIALGDGNLSNPNGRAVRLRISCDTKYPKLIEKIQTALRSLLPNNAVSIVKKKQSCVDISCYSNYWPKILGWNPSGSKYVQLVQVPEWIKNNKIYSIYCLRGLIETDGSIYVDLGYKMVMFTSIIPNLVESFTNMATNLGFEPKIYSMDPKSKWKSKKLYHVRISKNVEHFLELVKPEKI